MYDFINIRCFDKKKVQDNRKNYKTTTKIFPTHFVPRFRYSSWKFWSSGTEGTSSLAERFLPPYRNSSRPPPPLESLRSSKPGTAIAVKHLGGTTPFQGWTSQRCSHSTQKLGGGRIGPSRGAIPAGSKRVRVKLFPHRACRPGFREIDTAQAAYLNESFPIL